MDYDGKFRDFMVGWLAQQLESAETNRQAIETLYQAVIEAGSDMGARDEVRQVLGNETAHQVWNLSRQWHDPTVEQAGTMIAALRQRVWAETGDQTRFYLFFLNPFEEGCVPAGFEDRLEPNICWMFRAFYHTVEEAVLAAKGWVPDVIVEPSYEDASDIIVLAHPRENSSNQVFVYQNWTKAWHLHFASLPELAEELLRQRQAVEQRATPAWLGYHLTRLLTGLVERAVREFQENVTL